MAGGESGPTRGYTEPPKSQILLSALCSNFFLRMQFFSCILTNFCLKSAQNYTFGRLGVSKFSGPASCRPTEPRHCLSEGYPPPSWTGSGVRPSTSPPYRTLAGPPSGFLSDAPRLSCVAFGTAPPKRFQETSQMAIPSSAMMPRACSRAKFPRLPPIMRSACATLQ